MLSVHVVVLVLPPVLVAPAPAGAALAPVAELEPGSLVALVLVPGAAIVAESLQLELALALAVLDDVVVVGVVFANVLLLLPKNYQHS